MSAVRVDSEEPLLSSKEPDALLNQLRELEDHELAVQSLNRQEMLRDHRYYDGQQWEWADAAVLLARGQAPVSYNHLKPRLDWLTGTERRARVDFKVLPRQKGDRPANDARLKTDVMKYLSDVNSAPYRFSEVMKQSSIAGKSWIEQGINPDPDKELLYIRKEDWWNVLEDSCSVEQDGADMRYLFRRKHLDMDVAIAYFDKFAADIRNVAFTGEGKRRGDQYYLGVNLDDWDFGGASHIDSRFVSFDPAPWIRSPRKRVMFREAWHFVPTKQKGRYQGGSSFERVKMRLRLSIFIDNKVVFQDFSPYRHNAIPFVPNYCYRRAIDNAPYGIIRQLRDPQDSFNKRMSKSLFAISSVRVESEASAIDPAQMTERRVTEEIAKPNAHIRWAEGALRDGKVRITDGREVADAHLGFAAQDAAFIANTAGVNNENLGVQTNASSGIAIEKRQNEGTVSTTEIFDNLHFSRNAAGLQQLALIEQFYQAPRVFRVTGDANATDWREINTFNPDTGQYENDITEFAADFVLDQQAWQATMAQAAMAQMWELLQQMATVDPAFVRACLDLFIEYSNIPGKSTILKRIREITGYQDPSVPESPEDAAKRQAKEQLVGQQQQMEMEAAALKLAKMSGENKLLDAKAVGEVLKGFFTAMQAAQVNTASATLAPVADSLMSAAGFQDQQGQDPNIPAGSGQPALVAPDPQSAGTGANQGIETPAADTVAPGV